MEPRSSEKHPSTRDQRAGSSPLRRSWRNAAVGAGHWQAGTGKALGPLFFHYYLASGSTCLYKSKVIIPAYCRKLENGNRKDFLRECKGSSLLSLLAVVERHFNFLLWSPQNPSWCGNGKIVTPLWNASLTSQRILTQLQSQSLSSWQAPDLASHPVWRCRVLWHCGNMPSTHSS